MTKDKTLVTMASYKNRNIYMVEDSINKVINDPLISPFFKTAFEEYLKENTSGKKYNSEQHFFNSIKNKIKEDKDDGITQIMLFHRIIELGY